jgi:hypothetical protein
MNKRKKPVLVGQKVDQLSDDNGLGWYIGLIRYTKRPVTDEDDAHGGGKIKRLINRTIVVATVAPTRLIELMNTGNDEDIQRAATRASRDRYLIHDKPIVSKEDGVKLKKMFEYVCMLGPIDSRERTYRILETWEKNSRGQPSRALYARDIANQFGIGFSVNYKVILNTSRQGLKVHLIESGPDGGVLLYVYSADAKRVS